MTTTIEELERMCAAVGSIRQVAQSTGVTHQSLSKRLIKARAIVKASLELSDLIQGEMLREKGTGHRWQYVGPSDRLGCVRIASEGGADTMDMSIARLERIDPSEVSTGRIVFSWVPGTYGPHTKENSSLIDHALAVRKRLDQAKQGVRKADPDANVRAKMAEKAGASKIKTEI